MSFLQITDPTKRDFFVSEFLKSKRNIRESSISEKIGDQGIQRELTKLYKPITESQAGLATQLSAIQEATNDTSTALRALPTTLKALTFPQYPSIEAFEDPAELIRTLELGDIAVEYLQQYAASENTADKIFGLHNKAGGFYIGEVPITINGDDFTVGDKTYTGTPGLWELMTLKKPNNTIYDDSDLQTYAEILRKTGAMGHPNNPNKPRSNKSFKYREIVRPIWHASKGKAGKGVVILPSDPNALVEMLPVRVAAYNAGNTGVFDEVVAICDELLRLEVIDKESYKALTKIYNII